MILCTTFLRLNVQQSEATLFTVGSQQSNAHAKTFILFYQEIDNDNVVEFNILVLQLP